jgi:hypothetical protein
MIATLRIPIMTALIGSEVSKLERVVRRLLKIVYLISKLFLEEMMEMKASNQKLRCTVNVRLLILWAPHMQAPIN